MDAALIRSSSPLGGGMLVRSLGAERSLSLSPGGYPEPRSANPARARGLEDVFGEARLEGATAPHELVRTCARGPVRGRPLPCLFFN